MNKIKESILQPPCMSTSGRISPADSLAYQMGEQHWQKVRIVSNIVIGPSVEVIAPTSRSAPTAVSRSSPWF